MTAMGRAFHSFCLLSVMGVALQAPALADSVPFWGAKASVPIDTPINQLKKGEFLCPDPTKLSWLRIGVPGHTGEQGTQVDPNAVARIKMPAGFAARVNGILTPGATLFVTNEALYPQTSGPMVQVVDADPPAKSRSVHSGGS